MVGNQSSRFISSIFVGVFVDMRFIVLVLMLLGQCVLADAASAAGKDACGECRQDLKACVKGHTQGACKVNYDICIKHCRPSNASKTGKSR